MCLRITSKIVIRVSAILVLSASLAVGLASGRREVGNRENAFVNQETARQVDDQPLSPRLQALHERLKSGDQRAVDRFWKEIEQHGAPMIEPATDSDRDVLTVQSVPAEIYSGSYPCWIFSRRRLEAALAKHHAMVATFRDPAGPLRGDGGAFELQGYVLDAKS